MLKLITAYTQNKLIGKGDKLPWHIPAELEFFKNETMGKTIIMGERTFNGMPGLLPGRKTVILTLNKSFMYKHKDVEIFYSVEDLLEKYLDSDEVVYICGGATIYKLLLPFAKELIISHIHNEYSGDVYFPEWDEENYYSETIFKNESFTTVKYIKK